MNIGIEEGSEDPFAFLDGIIDSSDGESEEKKKKKEKKKRLTTKRRKEKDEELLTEVIDGMFSSVPLREGEAERNKNVRKEEPPVNPQPVRRRERFPYEYKSFERKAEERWKEERMRESLGMYQFVFELSPVEKEIEDEYDRIFRLKQGNILESFERLDHYFRIENMKREVPSLSSL